MPASKDQKKLSKLRKMAVKDRMRACPFISCQQIADEFGLSLRTVQRYQKEMHKEVSAFIHRSSEEDLRDQLAILQYVFDRLYRIVEGRFGEASTAVKAMCLKQITELQPTLLQYKQELGISERPEETVNVKIDGKVKHSLDRIFQSPKGLAKLDLHELAKQFKKAQKSEEKSGKKEKTTAEKIRKRLSKSGKG